MVLDEDVEIKLNIPALIPEEYLPDVHTRLIMYKRVANAVSDAELHELQVEMIDRFGLLSDHLKNLFQVTSLKLYARSIGISRLETGPEGGRIEFSPNTSVEPLVIVELVQDQPNIYRLQGSSTLKFKYKMETAAQRIQQATDLLYLLAPAVSSRQ
jgi:transcription-repair coupling factor (superfamily II helicase)